MKFAPFGSVVFLIVAIAAGVPTCGQEERPAETRFSAASPREAWSLLPRRNFPLPAWAHVLVTSLPKTTGSLLELDALHRSRNPLGVKLAAKVRWMAAHELESEYGLQYAEADLRRSGVSEQAIRELGNLEGTSPAEQAAMSFARRVTASASQISDQEFELVRQYFDVEQLVALVHTIAFANFENRIFLALDIGVEEEGPLPTYLYELDSKARNSVPAPARPAWKSLPPNSGGGAAERPEWDDQTFEDLTAALANQTQRSPRIPWPGPERLAKIPRSAADRAKRVAWSTLSMGYQPLLTGSWFECMGRFQQEASLDPVFENSVFWVITRTNDCFY
jgi:alkylhydroperoxidase family enzyme